MLFGYAQKSTRQSYNEHNQRVRDERNKPLTVRQKSVEGLNPGFPKIDAERRYRLIDHETFTQDVLSYLLKKIRLTGYLRKCLPSGNGNLYIIFRLYRA